MAFKIAKFKDRLAEALKIRGMLPIDLSKKAGIDKASISQWLSGLYEAKQAGVYKVAEVLDVNDSWLMGLDVPMERSTNSSKMVLGVRMAVARKIKGLTQAELAEKLNSPAVAILEYESGKRRPDVDTLKEIAKILGVDVNTLISVDEYQDEYELITDVLKSARIRIEPSGRCGDGGSDTDLYQVYDQNDEVKIEITYSKLAKTVLKVLAKAEVNKEDYIQRLLHEELFGRKIRYARSEDLTLPEYTHIKKYRVCDDDGKTHVDYILDREYSRALKK